jgi:ATP-dependent DNA ligase
VGKQPGAGRALAQWLRWLAGGDKLRRPLLAAARAGVLVLDMIEALFEAAMDQGLEGVVGKRLGSRHAPGRRSDAWVKVKRAESEICAVIGFEPPAETTSQA